MTLAMGHHAEIRCTAKNFLTFHTVAVHPTINCTLFFVTGEDDIARFDSRRYTTNMFKQRQTEHALYASNLNNISSKKTHPHSHTPTEKASPADWDK
jgi:hypothetical protein